MTQNNLGNKYNKIKERVLLPLVALVVIFIISYGYLVNKAVLNVVHREDLETKISKLSSDIGELEVKYISKVNEIDLELAYSLGFEEAEDKKFISRKPLGGSFSLEAGE